MDGGAWWAAVHGVAEGQTQLRDFTFTFHFHALEKDMATHSSVLAWRIPGTGEPGGLPSMGSHRVGHDWSDLAVFDACWIMTNRINMHACMHARLLQSCPTLCYPVDNSPPGSSVHRIPQARILEWVAISSPRINILVNNFTPTFVLPWENCWPIAISSTTISPSLS